MTTNSVNDNKIYYISFLIIIIVNIINFYTNFINPNINRILQVFIGIFVHNSEQNFIKLNSYRAKKSLLEGLLYKHHNS